MCPLNAYLKYLGLTTTLFETNLRSSMVISVIFLPFVGFYRTKPPFSGTDISSATPLHSTMPSVRRERASERASWSLLRRDFISIESLPPREVVASSPFGGFYSLWNRTIQVIWSWHHRWNSFVIIFNIFNLSRVWDREDHLLSVWSVGDSFAHTF